jgi:hypothetical protein
MKAPAVIVETTPAGLFAVRIKPVLSHRDLERTYPAAWRAWEWADLVAHETGWPLVDQTEARA